METITSEGTISEYESLAFPHTQQFFNNVSLTAWIQYIYSKMATV
jgi:hypothetical protein